MFGVSSTGYISHFPDFEPKISEKQNSEDAVKAKIPFQESQNPKLEEPDHIRGTRLNSLDNSSEGSDGEVSSDRDVEEYEGIFGVHNRCPLICFKNTIGLSQEYDISDESRFFSVEMRCPGCDINALPEQLVKDAVIDGKQIQIKRDGRVFKLNFHEGYGLTKSQVINSLAGFVFNETIDYREDIESIDVETISDNSIDVASMVKYTYLTKKVITA